jgi:hypothetical protein
MTLPSQIYDRSEIEELLLTTLMDRGFVEQPRRDYEHRDWYGRIITVPDLTWIPEKVAVFCDGWAIHRSQIEEDATKRNTLQIDGWMVLTFWGGQITNNVNSCAETIELALTRRGTQ